MKNSNVFVTPVKNSCECFTAVTNTCESFTSVKSQRWPTAAMFFDSSDFLVLAQLDIEGNILTKIKKKKSDLWSWRTCDKKPVNEKFHLIRTGNQTAKFVDGSELFSVLAQLGMEANTIGKFIRIRQVVSEEMR